MDERKCMWIFSRNPTENRASLVNVRDIFSEIDPSIINALPAWYIFTGCSYKPTFFAKTRKKTYNSLVKKPLIQDAFKNVGSCVRLSAEVCDAIEDFTCQLYNSDTHSVNLARVQHFKKAFTAKKGIYCVIIGRTKFDEEKLQINFNEWQIKNIILNFCYHF